jgi:hypothetical protein
MTSPASELGHFSNEPAWKRETLKCAIQHPLIQTDATLTGMAAIRERPRVVTLGIGLASQRTLSWGLPFDVLGMLLPAEQVRRAAGAERVVVLIADRHAVSNGFARQRVEHRAREVARMLDAVRGALGLPFDIVQAEMMHQDPSYERIHERVRASAGATHPYVTLEVADTEYLRRIYGSIVKLGWVLGRGPARDALDERFFDERFRGWLGAEVGFAYCAAGRTLDPRRPRAAPYLVFDPAQRLLLRPDEPVERKLAAFTERAPPHLQRAVTGHLRRITQVYSRTIAPLEGLLAERMCTVLQHIFSPCTGMLGGQRSYAEAL